MKGIKVAEDYVLGVKTIDVTPPVGVFLAGYAARTEVSTGVYHPLTATVIALGDGDTDMLIVSIEWLGFYDRTDQARTILAEATGIPAEQTLLLGTHTHCGPAMRELDARRHGESDVNETYITEVIKRLGEVSAEVMHEREAVSLWSGNDWCGFAASRRKPDNEGGILWEPSLDAPHDHEVPVVVAKDASGEPCLILFSYACHPTSTGPIQEIGGDYPGFAMTHLISEIPGCAAVFMKGCGGDQKPSFQDPKTGGFRKAEVEEVRANGISLGQSVLRTLSRPMAEVRGKIDVRQVTAELTTTRLDEKEVESLAVSSSAAERSWSAHFSQVLEAHEEPDRSVPMEVQSITIGSDLVIATMAGEINVEYGIRLKRELAGSYARVIPLGYANAIIGYVPVDRQLPEGGYEVIANQRAQLRTGPFEVGTEDKVINAVKSTVGV